MIKGVNRQIIEISDTGSPYFERALLVVQSNMSAAEQQNLHQAAADLLKNTGSCSHLRRERLRLWRDRVALAALSASGGALLTLLIQWMFA